MTCVDIYIVMLEALQEINSRSNTHATEVRINPAYQVVTVKHDTITMGITSKCISVTWGCKNKGK
jgi:hypothetical protein